MNWRIREYHQDESLVSINKVFIRMSAMYRVLEKKRNFYMKNRRLLELNSVVSRS